MASKKVSDQILLFEAANFKGTPKQFGTLASKIRESFPRLDSSMVSRIPVTRGGSHFAPFHYPQYMESSLVITD